MEPGACGYAATVAPWVAAALLPVVFWLLFRFSATNDALIKDWRAGRNLAEKVEIARPGILRMAAIAISSFGIALLVVAAVIGIDVVCR